MIIITTFPTIYLFKSIIIFKCTPKIFKMGQFLDYIASVFSGGKQVESQSKEKSATNNNSLLENSFTQAFGGKSESDKANKLASLTQSNRKTIYLYQSISAISFLVHLSLVTVPKIQLETFDLLEPQGWQLLTLSLTPLVVYLASFGAMNEINKPISEAKKLTSKNSTLDLNNNDFIQSLKIIILLTAICQVSSIFSEQALWFITLIVPIWCYQLTSKVAHTEYKRYASTPKKQWVKLNIARSPKAAVTPAKQIQPPSVKPPVEKAQPTPRTRTRRAVKNMINGMTENYNAFQQNVAHQISTKILNPLSPKIKAIE